MAYAPPIGAVTLNLSGTYAPPVGAVTLNLGSISTDDRTITVHARTGKAIAGIAFVEPPSFVISVGARTGGAVARIKLLQDVLLLHSISGGASSAWRQGKSVEHGASSGYRSAVSVASDAASGWRTACSTIGSAANHWRQSGFASSQNSASWRDGSTIHAGAVAAWRQSARVERSVSAAWRAAESAANGSGSDWWAQLPLLTPGLTTAWRQGVSISFGINSGFSQSQLLTAEAFPAWRQAGYPANARRWRPDPRDPTRWRVPWDTNLDLRCPLPAFPPALNLGLSACGEPVFIIYPARSYRVINSVSLVRLPDRQPLPAVSLSIETGSDQWCWSLSASLKGLSAYDLVKPLESGYPREVEATINGRVWRFVLDDVRLSERFGETSISLSGRSRSAWLDDPYVQSTSMRVTEARTAQQIAEQIIDNTGFTLTWGLDDWLVPAKTYNRQGTIINRLGALIKTVGGTLYSDPELPLLTAHPRYAAVPWLWPGLSPDLALPRDVLISVERQPVFSPPFNGIWLSGTQEGKLVFAKIAGTDGALAPEEPIVDSLFCDQNGIAARQRAIAELSQSGHGYSMDIRTHYPPELGLITDGVLIDVDNYRGVVRRVGISAEWIGDALSVIQTLTIEERPQ